MDMSNFRPELHIAQQSRRDKLRIQHDSDSNSNPPHHHLGVFVNNLEQISGNICYDPSEFCSEMLHFPVQEPEKRAGIGEGSYPNCSDPQYFSTWKSVGSQPSSDWMANHGGPMQIMNSTNVLSSLDGPKSYLGYQELHSSSEISNTNLNCSSSLYQSALQELVTSSNARSFGLEFASLRQKSSDGNSNHNGPWAVGGSELLLLPNPAYTDQLGLKGPSDLISRPAQGCNQWSGELDFVAVKDSDRDLRTVANDNSNTQALSLSLSSVPSPKVHESQIGDKDFQTRDICAGDNVQDSRTWPNPNLSTNCRAVGAHRNAGPLGPFTGYATILRSSKFLRPAQQLLDEICCIARPKNVEVCEVSDRIFDEVRVSSNAVSNGESALKAIAGESSVSSFAFNGSCDKSREPGGTSCSTDSHRPENLQKKAKLLFMQDEVCKRYKQYHQQMQMVVSSFESVAGLSAATPYVSLALKMIAKHFRCLKNAITDQLKGIKNALGEELSSPSGGTSSSKGGDAASVSMLKFFDQNFQKQKGAGGLGILEGQHIWRPQRGLPERAVSVLRAWLFDHFLHPYPTDTDKHMLAAQTGLTRNQVSNWFINARVRVWKPMVEEIHMLETKGATETGSEASRTNGKTTVENHNQPRQVECSSISHSEPSLERPNPNIWNQEKRSRIEYHIPSSVDGSLMGFVPSHRGGVEIGGLGSVSLTLGLRQSAENAQRPGLQQEHHFRPHFGGQIIRDFVG